jgi:hypothetical protein
VSWPLKWRCALRAAASSSSCAAERARVAKLEQLVKSLQSQLDAALLAAQAPSAALALVVAERDALRRQLTEVGYGGCRAAQQ